MWVRVMRLLFVYFLVHFASAASAETLNVYSPEQIQIGKVTLDDDAVSGCWTNLKESREYLEEQLRLNGYTLMETSVTEKWVTEEERHNASETAKSLPDTTPTNVVKSAFLTMIQKNLYDVQIQVHATRTNAGKCFGSVRTSLKRFSVGHHEDAVVDADFTYLSQIYIGKNNLNIEVLDLSKSFVGYLRTGELE